MPPLRDRDRSWREGASDGLESDAEAPVYVTDCGTRSRAPRFASIETLVHGPTLLWPDALSLGTDGALYMAVQSTSPAGKFLHRGEDQRVKPYIIYQIQDQRIARCCCARRTYREGGDLKQTVAAEVLVHAR